MSQMHKNVFFAAVSYFALVANVPGCVLSDEESDGFGEELVAVESEVQAPDEEVILDDLDSEVSLALGSEDGFAPAGAIGSCKHLRSFFLQFETGGDDLRDNSEVNVWIKTTNGDYQLQDVWGPFADHSTHLRGVTFANPNWSVNACNVTGVKIQMISHPDIFETADNWNLDGFAIFGYDSVGTYSYFLSDYGSPLKRFTASSPSLTLTE